MKQTKTILTLFLLCCCAVSAAANVTFKFAAHSYSGAYGPTMERNLSTLLTEITRAGSANERLNLSARLTASQMQPEAQARLDSLWKNAGHFTCTKSTVITKCIKDVQGYQVRGIAVHFTPHEPAPGESNHKELVISFDRKGTITGLRFAWDLQEDVNTMLKTSMTQGVSDVAERREILKWVEDLRCFYNEKNIQALEDIYSDDALIITGSVVKRRVRNGVDKNDIRIKEEVIHRQQTKKEYIDKLRRFFKDHIDVQFDHISIMSHSCKDNIYGVLLHQGWTKGTGPHAYHDEGWLFLVWDFTNRDKPQIHVRTWQSDKAAAQDGTFALDDFFFP